MVPPRQDGTPPRRGSGRWPLRPIIHGHRNQPACRLRHPRPPPNDTALRARARRVTPGGMTGHLNAAYVPPGYPQFFERGDGCRLWDVEGRQVIDFMCSWWPNLLGLRPVHQPECPLPVPLTATTSTAV